ncbi:RING finger domain protein [Fusarium sp. NRRL 52700]|nr:RING finger domain protein [Fusarium sp. NRRL 52700]
MVSAHSKRNTSRPVFTSHERALAKSHWSSSSARLHRDSFLPFGSCGLCLNIAREPVSCRRGDIFCRECALSNILTQKKEIKRAQKARAAAEEEIAKQKAHEDELDRERAIQDFELTQAGLDRENNPKVAKTEDEKVDAAISDSNSQALVVGGTKRKFELDKGELDRIAREDKAKARKALEEEKVGPSTLQWYSSVLTYLPIVQAAKPHLPSFWTPSLTPDAQSSKLPPVAKKDKTVPTCPASAFDRPHPITMQNLITINFNEEETSKGKQRTCPSCLKMLTNASNPMMTRECGHVLCHSCAKQFMIPSSKATSSEDAQTLTCYVCDVPLASKSHKTDTAIGSSISGLIALQSEGTGFSAHGGNTVERSSVAFQC